MTEYFISCIFKQKDLPYQEAGKAKLVRDLQAACGHRGSSSTAPATQHSQGTEQQKLGLQRGSEDHPEHGGSR